MNFGIKSFDLMSMNIYSSENEKMNIYNVILLIFSFFFNSVICGRHHFMKGLLLGGLIGQKTGLFNKIGKDDDDKPQPIPIM